VFHAQVAICLSLMIYSSTSTFVKILFLYTLYICSVLKTKDEPKNAEIENVLFVKIVTKHPSTFTSVEASGPRIKF
jgi:hypothetical protein